MESVFYAKRSKDTTFFDRLATKKNEGKCLLYFGAILNKRLFPVLITIRYAQQSITTGWQGK